MAEALFTAARPQQCAGILAKTGPGQLVAYVEQGLGVSVQCSNECAQVLLFAAQQKALGQQTKAKPIQRQSFIDQSIRIGGAAHAAQQGRLQAACIQTGGVGKQALLHLLQGQAQFAALRAD